MEDVAHEDGMAGRNRHADKAFKVWNEQSIPSAEVVGQALACNAHNFLDLHKRNDSALSFVE